MMNACRVVRAAAAACAVALTLAAGVADAVTRTQTSACRALQTDAAVDSLAAQICERKREPDSAVVASSALLSVSSFWNHSSSSKLSPPAYTAASTRSKHHPPDVYQLKDNQYFQDATTAYYSEESSFAFLDEDSTCQQLLWKADNQARSVSLQPRDDELRDKLARGVSSQVSWTPQWKAEVDSRAVLWDASCSSSCYHASSGLNEAFGFTQERQSGRDCGHSPSKFLQESTDFSAVFEEASALNVDEIDDVLSVLEEVASDALPLPSSSSADMPEENERDAQNTNPVTNEFVSLEQGEAAELLAAKGNAWDAATVDDMSGVFSSSLEEYSVGDGVTATASHGEPSEDDAAAVELLPALEKSTGSGDAAAVAAAGVGNLTQPNWIDSLEMDNISSCLFPETQQPKNAVSLPHVGAMAPVIDEIDSRVYVPKFSVRIEGRPPVAAVHTKPVGQRKGSSFLSTARSSRLPVDPPAFLVGPPAPTFAASSLSRKDRVERWKEKRRVRSFVPRAPNPNLSESRKAVAAKRQRIGGRFIGCGGPICAPFVPVTALQS